MESIAIDMDGTLLSSDNKISQTNAEALKKWQADGRRFIIATGRGLNDAKRLLAEAGVESDGFVCANGGIIGTSNEILHRFTMNQKLAYDVASWLSDNNYYYHMFTEEGIFTTTEAYHIFLKEMEHFAKTYEDPEAVKKSIQNQADMHIKNLGLKEIPNPSTIIESDMTVYKFLVVSLFSDKLETISTVWDEHGGVLITSSGKENIEIMAPEAEKGTGLKRLLPTLNTSIEETVVIGDSYNDLSMFQAAGTSVAMGNANPDVKEAADYVTAHHDEDGVAQAIEAILAGQTPSQETSTT
ncbi:hypothetical protein B0H94_11541 [Salsuginibacillus halophilus]|uniref:Cof subfamily protein (Haloacid dehalogenase superfamily)/HAD superfamily hydrolase (TIGR01484 family) n=1 Tax=Salsuginibacillus halophilus TaxID=517424 RepID=A0A2P8H878_9BACI|nr:Cof-type HAD-IIB family hydrolase [Salsuginibacillus halophilus]PSL42437.1 hypothetical protein B0H94_11541 [Salsuginibacillus halophilus]